MRLVFPSVCLVLMGQYTKQNNALQITNNTTHSKPNTASQLDKLKNCVHTGVKDMHTAHVTYI